MSALLRHLRLRRRVDAYVDGELGCAARRLMLHHLGECQNCRGEVEVLYRIRASLRRRAGRRRGRAGERHHEARRRLDVPFRELP